jgi:hydrogenase/urease accessory protein HupE
MKAICAKVSGLLVLFSQQLSAHPGHGMGEGHTNDVLHPFLGSDHVLLLGAVAVAALLVRNRWSAPRSARDDEEEDA